LFYLYFSLYHLNKESYNNNLQILHKDNDRTPFGTRKPITNGYNNSAQDYFLRGALSKDGLTFGFNIWDVKEGLSSYVPGYEYFANTPNIPFMKHHRGLLRECRL
jgi:hypothetical protein